MSDMSVSEYSEKAIVLRGEDTRSYKDQITSLGGKFNSALKGGPGWIFSKKMEEKVQEFVDSVNTEQEHVPTVVAPPQQSSDSLEDILASVKKYLESRSEQERLLVIGKIAYFITTMPEKSSSTKTVKVVTKTFARPTPSTKTFPKTFAKPATEVSSDQSDDEEVARPRLLG